MSAGGRTNDSADLRRNRDASPPDDISIDLRTLSDPNCNSAVSETDEQHDKKTDQRARELERINEELLAEVAQRMAAEQALDGQMKRFMAIMENFPEVLYVVDPKTYQVEFVNKAFASVLGKNPVGGLCYEEFQGLDAPCAFCTNDIILENRKPYTWEHHNPKVNKDYYITDQIIQWPDGREMRFEVATDVTRARQAETRLEGALRELERSNEDLQQFAYVVSHDLQEPLRKMSSFSELLRKKYGQRIDEKADMYIDYIVDGSARMQEQINDLLQFSRVTGKDPKLQWFSSDSLLEDVLFDLEYAVNESGARIDSSSMPEVFADRALIGHVLQNLIGNAIKFSGGNKPEIVIRGEGRPGDWLFFVKDNGEGIEAEYLEKIFIIFQRLHSRKECPGSGIGLAICKKAVDRHGGRLWVESTPGEGSCFYFTIPKHEEEGG